MPLIVGFYANICLVILVLIEQISFSGVIFGFNSLSDSYKHIKVFYYLCKTNTTNESESSTNPQGQPYKCELQSDMYSRAFIVWTVVINLCALPIGSFFDHFGIRITKIISAVVFLVGCICFAFASESYPYFLFPAGIFCAVSAQLLMISNLQVSQVFPRYQSIIVSLFCGAFDSSSVIFELIRLGLMKLGISLMTSFLCLGVAGFSLEMLTAVFLLPRHTSNVAKLAIGNVKSSGKSRNNNETSLDAGDKKLTLIEKEDADELDEIKFQPDANHELVILETDEVLLKPDNALERRYPSLKSCIFSRFFYFHVLFFAFILLRFTFFLTSLEKLLETRFGAGNFIPIISKLSYFLFSGIIVAPLTGLLIDSLRARCVVPKSMDSDSAYWYSLRPLVAAISICCVAALLMSIMVFLTNEIAIYAAYVFLVICRAFLFSCQSASLLIAFPIKYFGTCFGIAFFSAGLFALLQYVLLKVASISLLTANIILVVMCLISFLHPIQIYLGNRFCRSEKSNQIE